MSKNNKMLCKLLQESKDNERIFTILKENHVVIIERNGLIMLTRSNNTNHYNEYTSICNGLIFDTDWNLICMPPRTLCRNFITKELNARISEKKCTVAEAKDGTTFTLYNYKNKWHIATTRGISMAEFTWVANGKTYEKMIEECFETVKINYEDLFAKLDLNRCYSFGFRHPEIHAFKNDKTPSKEIWFIQYVDKTFKPFEERFFTPPINCPKNTTIDRIITVHEMTELCNAEINDSAIFGFIIRSEDMKDYIIEGSLLRFAKKIFYHNRIIQISKKTNVPKLNISLLLVILEGHTDRFIKIYPQFAKQIDNYNNILVDLAYNNSPLKEKFKHEFLQYGFSTVTPDALRQFITQERHVDLLIESGLFSKSF